MINYLLRTLLCMQWHFDLGSVSQTTASGDNSLVDLESDIFSLCSYLW